MKKTTIGIFVERNDAEKFINYVHNEIKIPHEDISYIYKDVLGIEREVDTEEISSLTTAEGAEKGAKTGAVVGALGGIAAVAGVIPIVGMLFAAGPLIAAIGITGALGTTAAGAVTGAAIGGIIGALANLGVGKERAKDYEDRVLSGNILVAVNSEQEKDVEDAMAKHNALEVETYVPSV
ncbi:MAG: hypothetical protein WCT29_00155 [Candidatus Paceibacterota bacterium]|jgi:hypothetical protein